MNWIYYLVNELRSWIYFGEWVELYLKLYSQKIDQLIIMKSYKNFQKISSFIDIKNNIFQIGYSYELNLLFGI